MTGSRRSTNLMATLVVLLVCTGCNTAKLLAPPPPLRAASASAFAIDVEFAEPLDRGTAEDPARYTVLPLAGGTATKILDAALIDTLNARAVQLLVTDSAGNPLPDSSDFSVQTNGVLTIQGKSTGVRTVDFRTGLNYSSPLGDLFARHCDSCHGATLADGNYRTDSYAGLSGIGTNSVPNLIPGDVRCLLVVKTKPSNSMFNRGELSYLDSELIRNWVVSYGARL